MQKPNAVNRIVETSRAGASAAGAALLLALAPAATLAQPASYGGGGAPPEAAAAPGLAASTVPPAIQQVRRHMLDADVNSLTFHAMDQIFYTRVVGRSGPVWELPSVTRPLDFTYVYDGKTYAADEFLERNRTNALLILKGGKIVTEIYRNNTGPNTRFMSWSMAKSITSLMVGLAVSEGRIHSIDDPIVRYLPELKDGGYKAATIRDVLEMKSGVDYEERYDFEHPGTAARNHESSLVENVTRFADAARTIPSKAPPGTLFQYKTLDTAVLGWLVERVAGMNAASYMTSRIWERLGAQSDAFFIMDGPPGVGREFTGAGFNATLRDYARLGQMVLDGGSAHGEQIVPKAWIEEATRSYVKDSPEGGYGYQWWVAPGGKSFYALGLQGQYIFVDPASRTVIVKLSYFKPGDQTAYAEAAAFMQAAAAWRPN
ncbi:serine hydrolase domain-containing protein [Phenylobacterium montanum]|uniref:Serine hydrolase n=1 Tax=Phenylobacterium montanum TaxID=2823693 RepID=A0A975G4Q7_9CAUL|nr:serine hydrolase [Caulobacter sp. S6]QUD90547.1 serine hydrolase [Caulobacter sp. S6]